MFLWLTTIREEFPPIEHVTRDQRHHPNLFRRLRQNPSHLLNQFPLHPKSCTNSHLPSKNLLRLFKLQHRQNLKQQHQFPLHLQLCPFPRRLW